MKSLTKIYEATKSSKDMMDLYDKSFPNSDIRANNNIKVGDDVDVKNTKYDDYGKVLQLKKGGHRESNQAYVEIYTDTKKVKDWVSVWELTKLNESLNEASKLTKDHYGKLNESFSKNVDPSKIKVGDRIKSNSLIMEVTSVTDKEFKGSRVDPKTGVVTKNDGMAMQKSMFTNNHYKDGIEVELRSLNEAADKELDAIVEDCKEQLLSGVLPKNVKTGLINKGTSEVLAEKIMKLAELTAKN